MVRTYNANGGYLFAGLDRGGDFRILIPESGALLWCADGNQTIVPDTNFNRSAAATMSLGNGTVDDYTGTLKHGASIFYGNGVDITPTTVEEYTAGLNVKHRHRVTRGTGTGSGGETFYKEENFFGINIGDASGTRQSTSQCASEIALSLKAWNGTYYHTLYRYSYVDETGTVRIPFHITGSYDAANIIAQYQCSRVNYMSLDGNTVALNFQTGNSSASLFLGSFAYVSQFTAAYNNSAVVRQRNAANSAYLNLPYIDAGNVCKVEQPFYAVGGRPAAGATYTNSFATFQMTAANSGDFLFYVLGPTFTGSLNVEYSAAPTTRFNWGFYNNSANSTAHARFEIRTINGSGGDPSTLYNINGLATFAVGIDNSDSDRFKISCSGDLGTNDRFVIDNQTSGTASFGFNGFSIGGGQGVIFIANATTVPASNPTGGGILYVESGALKYRGSGGTVTTIANA